MKSLYYICTQPATLFYAWQVEVMVNNFLKNGISSEHIHIVSAIKQGDIPSEWRKLQSHFPSVGFFFYEDDRKNDIYPVTVRPHILKKHFTEHPYLTHHAVMYHDCDMVFTKPVAWEAYLQDDIWYGSDTISYIGSSYIKSKKYGVYERMCEIVDISESVPLKNELNTIGAQMIMKNVTADYWMKVEKDCDALYEFFMNHLKAFPYSVRYHPIQKWTAEMWAILWNAWYFKHETRVVKDMEFIWPGHKPSEWDEKYIYHNAGVLGPNENKHFFKGMYMNKLPYDIRLEDFNPHSCSYKYVEAILDTAKTSCLL